ncbi:MAG: PH domain-containing protein [Actinomycetota bacterium]|nr:PH domain-containing protein [Actinomycetota bacterium]
MTDPEPASQVTTQHPSAPQPVAEPPGDADEAGASPDSASVPREPQWRVARAAIGLWTVEAVIRSLFLMIPVLGASIFVPDEAPRWLVAATDILPWALAVLFLAQILILPPFKYAVHRWEVTADGVYTLTGWLSRTWVLVPISRIQTVDVTRGPLQRIFGLASVSVRTASAHGSVEIHQLEQYTAAQVADDLAKRANLYDDDAT